LFDGDVSRQVEPAITRNRGWKLKGCATLSHLTFPRRARRVGLDPAKINPTIGAGEATARDIIGLTPSGCAGGLGAIGTTRSFLLSLMPHIICHQTGNQPSLKTIKHRAVAMHFKKIFFFTVLLLAVSGCDTINHRIREKPAAFNRLDPKTQAEIRRGGVEVGYTPDMVYLALGKPDKIEGSTWYYKVYCEEGDGPLYVRRYEEDFTIPFADGKVTDGLKVTINGVRVQ
jgi:hypothetical protein